MRQNSLVKYWCVVLVLLLVMPVKVQAAQSMVTLRATQDILLADGKQQTVITAEVHDINGRLVNGAAVEFQTTAGTLTETRVSTFNGLARTRLISSPVAGVAHVTAIAEGVSAGASNVLDIEFTNDPEETFAGNSFMLVTGNYVAYSVTDQTIESRGDNGTARLTYRNFEITADRLQLKCDDSAILRANDHILLRRGKSVVHAIRLYYSMATGQGYAIADWKGRLQQVMITGEHLTLSASPGQIPATYLTLPDLQVKLVVVARSLSYFPGEKLQFRKPRFFQDQLQIMSLPYYEMQLNSQELFSDHFLSVGSSGLGLQLPYYYNLSPRTSGIILLHHQQPLARGYFSTDPGWGIDLMQAYTSNGMQRYEGSYGFTNLMEGNWGFQWTHTHEFSPATQGAFDLEFPHHDSVFSSANLTQQSKLFHVGLDLTAGQTFIGAHDRTLLSDTFAETNPHQFLGIHGMEYVLGTKFSTGSVTSSNPLLPSAHDTSEELTLRSFLRPIAIDHRTTFNSSFTVGNVWAVRSKSGMEALATLALERTLSNGGSLHLSYDFLDTPGSVFNLPGSGKHRIGLAYQMASGSHLKISLFGSAFLDTPTTSLLADVVYRLTPDWRLIAFATIQQDATASFNDFEFTLGRRIGARELELTYSTFYKRVSVDLTTTQW